MNKEKIYSRLPVFLQNLTCSIEGWRINRMRYSRQFWKELSEAESRSFLSPEEIQAYRDQRLQEFVRHCAASVPYYRDQFEALRVNPQQILSLEDLAQLPILTKAEVQENGEQFRAQNIASGECITAHTGGTTGGGLRFPSTLKAQSEQWAIWWRYRHWHGIPFDEWCGYFGGRSVVPTERKSAPFWRFNYPGRHLMFSTYHLNERNLPFYVAELRRSKPRWLHGYPSLLALLAAFLIEAGIDLGYEIKWVTIGAENLLQHQADLIQRGFGCRVIQHYGMTEAVANISECPLGALHVDEDFAAVEFIPSMDGTGTRIIGTNFSNYAFPLLRYDPQDNVTLGAGSCSCGRPGRVIQEIDGRREDYLVLADGARIACLNHVFKDLVQIREAQLHQYRIGEVEAQVVRSRNFRDSDERALISNLKQKIGKGTSVHITYVDSLPRTASGKLRMVVSHIESAQKLAASRELKRALDVDSTPIASEPR